MLYNLSRLYNMMTTCYITCYITYLLYNMLHNMLYNICYILQASTLLIPNVGSGTHRPVRHERIQTVCYLSCNSTASYSSWSYSCGQRKPSAAEAVNTKQMLTAMSRSVRRRGPGRTRTRARAGRRSCDELRLRRGCRRAPAGAHGNSEMRNLTQ